MNNNHLLSIPAAQQINHNTSSWIGRRMFDQHEVSAGQTFVAAKDGDLDKIEVFSSMVTLPGLLHITLYQYDRESDQWGSSLGSASLPVNAGNYDQWLVFKMPGLHLHKNVSYGFQLESNDTYVAIGEEVGSAGNRPYEAGKQWRFSKQEQKADSYQYFSLAFKVALSA